MSVAVNDGGGAVSVSFWVDVFDTGGDVTRLVATILDSTGTQVNQLQSDVSSPPGLTFGTYGGSFPISTTAPATFALEFQAFDAGGGGSNVLQATLSVEPANPVPTVTSLSPESVNAGGPPFALTVTGTGFVPSSSVLWNGSSLSTTYVDETTLRASVLSYSTSYSGTAQVTVWNPPPGGGASAPLTFTVDLPLPNPVPTITSISPTSVDAGGPSFTLTLTGTGFVPSSSVQWSGYPLSTTFVDGTTLQATVPSDRLSSVGLGSITVYNPWPAGGTSSPATFAVTLPPQPGVTLVSLAANDLVWDPYQQKIYLSVPSASPVHPNTVTELDPFTGQLGAAQLAGSEPGRLALSDDGQFLYVGLGGASSVNRFTLPGLAFDLEVPLGRDATFGPYFARDLQVAPGAPRVLAVSLETSGYSVSGGVAVFDDAVERPTKLPGAGGSFASLQWGSSASVLYAATQSYPGDLSACSVDPSGVSVTSTFRQVFGGSTARIHLDPGTGLVYGDDGHAVDPTTGAIRGTFSTSDLYSAVMIPDSSLDSAYLLGSPAYYSSSLTLRAYALTQYFQTSSTTLSFLTGPATRLIRWGPDGLALLTPGRVVLVRGEAVLPVSPTANPTPQVTSLVPSSVTAGTANFRLTVTGAGFVPGSILRWNGSDRSTRFVSSTEVVAYIPASDVASGGSSQIAVVNPSPGGGASDPVTFTTDP